MKALIAILISTIIVTLILCITYNQEENRKLYRECLQVVEKAIVNKAYTPYCRL